MEISGSYTFNAPPDRVWDLLMDPAVHRTLVREHRWTIAEYAHWIERAALAELVDGSDGGA